MAIDRFQNPDILTDSKVPVTNVQTYALLDAGRLKKTTLGCTKPSLDACLVESHIYSADNLIVSHQSDCKYEVSENANYTYDIILKPEKDVRRSDIQRGYYSIVYNFLDTVTNNLQITNISSDSTEIELELVDTKQNLTELYNLIKGENTYKDNLVLNFGDNNIVTITDISFENNPKRGEIVQNVRYPYQQYDNKPTIFVPSQRDSAENFWVELYRSGRTTTGRAAKFTPGIDSNGNIVWEQELDSNLEPIYYTKGSSEFDRQYDIDAGLRYNLRLPTRAQIRYYNPSLITNKITKVVVKLYKELPADLENKFCRINNVVRDSYIERVLVYPYIKEEQYDNFSAPNFKIDMGNYGKSQGTDFKTWNSLLDTNLSTSQQIIDKYLSGSFGEVNLNIDYGNFKNFVNYSSAVERVNNFKYKLELIESYDSRIKTLSSVSGSQALTNISQSLLRKNNVVSGMDGWERWMYRETTGSLYTHYSASSYVIEPWPHYSENPKKLYSVTSSQAISHYNGLIDSASIFDAFNDNRLTKSIPASIVEDPLNSDFVLFVDMIGHHYDITWSYIKALTSLNEREEHPYDGMPNEMLYDVAKSMGWKLTHGKDRSDLWKFAGGTDKFGNYAQTGSLQTKTDEQINYEVWRRIVNNIPYLLKTKGSARAVKALIATYGIPQAFLSIREYGGPAIEDKRHIWEHDRFVYHLRMDTDNYITAPWDKIADINPITYKIENNIPGDGALITYYVDIVIQNSIRKFFISTDGGSSYQILPELVLDAGNTYRFDTSAYQLRFPATDHDFRFARASDDTPYTDGVTVNGSIGFPGSYIEIEVTENTPALVYYDGREGGVNVNSNSITINEGGPNPIDTIEIQFQQNLIRTSSLLHKGSDFAVLLEPTSRTSGKGNIHFYLSGSGGYKSASIDDVLVFDSKMSTLLVQREVSVDDITQNNEYKIQYRRNRKDRISINKSASISIDGSTESSYNAAWTGSGTLTISNTLPTSNTPSIWADAEYMSGSIQEIRYWGQPLKDIVVDEHTLSRESYHGNSVTSSYFDLKFRFIPDSQLKNVTNPDGILSQHPNRQVTTSNAGYILSASLFNFERDDLRGVTEEYYTKVPSAGANNIMNNKVRVESNRLTGILDPDKKKEKSQYDSAPVDSNQVGVYMSATKMYNEDIYNHTGYFEIDDYIGNPDRRPGYTEQNEELDYVRRQVFKKYSSKNLINDTIDMLARYDFSVFEQIRQTMPARVDYNSGILIEPHILERPKMKSKTNVSYTNPQYDVVLPAIDRPVSSEYIHYDTTIIIPHSESADYILYETTIPHQTLVVATKHDYTSSIDTTQLRNVIAQKDDVESIGNPNIRDMYSPSTYRYTILFPTASNIDIGFGGGWTTGSNGYWNYNTTASAATDGRLSKYALKNIYFYDTALSASLRLSNSSSLVPADVSTDELPLSIANLRYLGCKMTSDSLTSNSPDTPDGRPVVEIFEADPNVLIYTSQTAEEGNLDVDTSTNLPTLKLEDLKVNDDIKWSREQEYREAVAKFRKEIEKLIQIENSRRAEFDLRYEQERIRFELEQQRREEFDIINRPNRIVDL